MSFSAYKERLKRNGNSDSDAIHKRTVDQINMKFKDSPSYALIKHNGIDTDARIIEGKKGFERFVLFRPDAQIDVGDYVDYLGRKWLIFDTYEDKVSPKALITSCNETLSWIDRKGKHIEMPVFALATRNTRYDILPDRWDVDLLAGMIYIIAKSTEESRSIEHSMRFIIGHNTVYEVAGIDDVTFMRHGGNGMIQFTFKITTRTVKDDFVNRIADNSYFYDSTNKVDENKGDSGDIW
ncbi:hypothetical protein M5X17_27440 [Paenibacillus alvei]|uniref:hypothetical protein n=1 Tax=Paenibacillus alvei TaxID=44250 RepID=UPI00228134E4|nr:hypothetical protein [Paenibacillus alvei]MCY9737439.1 hypothetical protein [Paenibacillus alvei]